MIPVYTGTVVPENPWHNCQWPSDPREDDVVEAAIIWVAMREFYRAGGYPGKMAGCDAAFRRVFEDNINAEQFRETYPWIQQDTDNFGQQFETVLRAAGIPGGNPSTCTIDWQRLACWSYWFAKLSENDRNAAIKKMVESKMLIFPFTSACPQVMADPVYPKGTLPTTQFPRPSKPSSPRGLTTGQKIGIGVGVALVAVVAGLAGHSRT